MSVARPINARYQLVVCLTFGGGCSKERKQVIAGYQAPPRSLSRRNRA
jgi:hypothetical protein